ncbi:UNVERIFIED_CONTAM: hypothetical protein PYX00_007532 [Menopon gallinae]|uniref:H/ACA ribonucleoprotein complex non-core subunit NAF1 n=1 Tax=Menopon gallinae TaxID=328185 RepID=A0AAW2HJ51_9NEOP
MSEGIDSNKVLEPADSVQDHAMTDMKKTAEEGRSQSCEITPAAASKVEESTDSEPAQKNGDEKVQQVEIDIEQIMGSKPESHPEVLVNKPLCADYRSESDSDTDSDSDSDSIDSETDSDSSSSESESDSSDNGNNKRKGENKQKREYMSDLPLSELPPVEKLTISVPEEECQEIGTISSIVDTLVVVPAYKNIPALDLDTVLFLEKGEVPLGKVFDVLGPVSEPVYIVRFNNKEEIAEKKIEKGMKVYCAPRTEYTSLVFVSELMKMKGSDASWRNNEEVPAECQDFSDDEAEIKFKKEQSAKNEEASSSSENKGNKKVKTQYQNNRQRMGPRQQRFNHPGARHPPPGAWRPGMQQQQQQPRNPFWSPGQPAYQYPPVYNPVPPPIYHQAASPYPQPYPYVPYMYHNPFVPPPPPPPNVGNRPNPSVPKPKNHQNE